jgi:benzoylformate decarboxylase
MATVAEVLGDDAIVVLEAPSATLAARSRLRLSAPGSYYFSASGGLGFGLAAAIGVQLAQPSRPVLCILGEGSAQYAVTGLWTAVAHRVPVTFLVLRNEEYAILKWFAQGEGAEGAPGLDLPRLETAAVAAAYGMTARRTGSGEELRVALAEALAAGEPRLLEVAVAPGMSF